jgi:hypothetical protein
MYRWHILGTNHYATYCAWCGVDLEEWRKLQAAPRLLRVTGE